MPHREIQQHQKDTRERRRHLAMQLMVQMVPACESRQEAQAVLAVMQELVEWHYGADQPDLRAVGNRA